MLKLRQQMTSESLRHKEYIFSGGVPGPANDSHLMHFLPSSQTPSLVSRAHCLHKLSVSKGSQYLIFGSVMIKPCKASIALMNKSLHDALAELPLEIHYYIVAALDNWSDAGTIANCALVCRAWLLFSRSVLYRAVFLQYKQQWDSFESQVLHPTSRIAKFPSQVRQLRIWVRDSEFFDQARTLPRIGWEPSQEHPWAHNVLDRCSSQLNGLRNIELERVDWTPTHELAISCGRFYHSLTTLSMHRCVFSSVLQLHKLVASFPVLSDLTLHSLLLRSTAVPVRFPSGAPSLARLDLECANDVIASVSMWLSRTQFVHSVSHLEWWPWIEEEAEESWRTLATAIGGTFLQELHYVAHPSFQGMDIPLDKDAFGVTNV